jgi:hypothetical protein
MVEHWLWCQIQARSPSPSPFTASLSTFEKVFVTLGTNSIFLCFSLAHEETQMTKITTISFALLLSATTAYAQSETPSTSQTTPAVNTEHNPGAPVAGKNSFTEAQAKERIEGAGYTDVTGLKLDDQGVWRAAAKKDGKDAGVSLDFQGNVTMAK